MEDETVWAMFFCNLVGFRLHPGFNRENTHLPTLEECAQQADEALKLYRSRFPCQS